MYQDEALRAFLRGDLAEADRHLVVAPDIDLELALIAATRSRQRAAAALSSMTSLGAGVAAFLHALAGNTDAARQTLRPELFDSNSTSAQFAAEAVALLGETALVPAALAVMQSAATRHPMLRPVAIVVGELCLLDGRIDAAIENLEAGLAVAREMDAGPHVASAATALARALDTRGLPGDRERAVVLSAEAHERWKPCSIV